ncbi:Ig-like domain-containing protein [Limnohabitans sp. B9-3]|uniref:Ig-like domain-containing protein n=1 Tax=Limnohabitans sp. B9-3 TaxID=1100707 RepID=UPI000C1E0ADD|nr:Ig-like domain-containing protein [Limnohabitans sp. B9-3]PIT77757.1 hypothetical protein B9Z42_04715 [Limnohabitans sp. B9-3]
MATAANNASLILNISGTQSVVLKRGEKTSVIAKAGQRYRVVKEGEEAKEAAAKDVAASQKGQDLLLSYADGTQVLLVSFYEACKAEQCAVDMPGAKGTGTSGGYVITGDSAVGASLSDGGKLVYAFGDTPSMAALTQGAEQARGFSHQDSLSTYMPPSDAAVWTPMQMGLGVVGVAALLHQNDKASVPTVIRGTVVAGPVLAGNGLTAVAYKADGTVLASGAVNADGTFTLNVGNDYLGGVLVKVSDTNANPDYFDEATGAPKDLSTDLRALTVIPTAGTYNVSVNVLTELAVRNLGLSGGDTGNSSTTFTSVNATQITQANQKVAASVGLSQDLVLGAAPVAIITTTGASNAQSNDYGRLLAALSGAEVGSDTNAVLVDLATKLQSTQAQATGQVLETLLEGAAKVNLVAAISDITNQKSTAITIGVVSQDNRLSPTEMIAGVEVQGTAAAGASVVIAWSDSTGTATATGTRTVTADSQGRWSTSFTSAEMPALGATTLKATVGSDAATRSIYLDEPLAPTITLTQMTGSGNLTSNGHVDVSGILNGAGWDYSLDGGANWTAGSGSGFTATGDGAKQVLVRQNIGGHTSPSSNTLNFSLDTATPAVTLSAVTDDVGSVTGPVASGSSTDDTALVLSGTNEAGATVAVYNGTTFLGAATVSGTNWTYSATVANGSTYQFNATATDAAGNTSAATANHTVIGDTAAPAVTLSAVTDDVGSVTGPVASGSSTDDTALVLSGTNEAGASVAVYNGTTLLGAATVSGTNWTYNATVANGSTYQFNATATDAAGNTSAATANHTVIGDTAAPAVTLSAVTDDVGNVTGPVASGSSTDDTALVLSGTNEAGATVAVYNGTTLLGAATVTGTNWTYSATVANGSTYQFNATATDAAGNTSAATTYHTVIGDTAEPTVTISSSATSLGANATATLTFTLSEAIANFSDTSITVTGGTLSNFSGSGTSYTATFTPDAGLSGAATVNVAASALTDAAGNSNSAASNTVSISVDTQAPTVASITASRSSLLVDQTASLNIMLSEASTTFGLADLQAVGGTLSNLQGSGSSYTATFTPDDNRTAPGSVSVTSRSFSDAAGNDSEKSDNDGVVMAIQTLRPTATLQARQTKLGMGDATTIDITLSEKSNDFVVGDLTASHGTLSEFTPKGDGMHYSVVFTPEAPFTGTGGVTLADGRFTNAAGNSNKGEGQVASTDSLAIDTTPPTVTITSDVTALSIGQSAKVTFTFNKDPGDSFDAKDITVNGGTLTNLVNNTGTIWTARFTPTDGSTGQASITVASGRYTDGAGNKGAAGTTPAITIDTQGPVADSLLPGNATTVLPGHALVLNFNEVVHKGTGNLVLVDDTAATRTSFAVSDTAVVLSNDGKTLTITPTTALVAGNQYHVEAAPGTLLDAAGNAWAGIASSDWANSGWHFTAATPSVSLNKISTDNRVNGVENTAGVTVSGVLDSETLAVVQAFQAGDFTVTLTQGGISIPVTVNSYVVTNGVGAWSGTTTAGAFTQNGTYSVNVTASRVISSSTVSAQTTGIVLVDLSASAPTLTLLNDTGTSNSDDITSDATVSVAVLEDKASWEYSTDSGSTWQAGSGTQFTGASTEGAHTVLVRQTDAAGNVSSNGTLSFTLDTSAAKPVINAIATDNIINASEVGSVISGTAEAGASVQLMLGNGKQERTVTITADGSGNWTHTLNAADLAAMGRGQTQITATQTDVAGNTSFTTLRNLTVDTFAPTVSIEARQTQLTAVNGTTTLTFTLSEESTDFTASSVTVTGGTLSGFAGSGTQYSATFTPTNAATTAGSVKVAAGAFSDAAGNTNAEASNRIELSVDTVVPTVAVSSNAATLLAGETATLTFTLSEASDSFGADSLNVVGGTLSPLSANAARTVYTSVFTPTPSFAGAGSVTVANSAFFDRAGNVNADGADTNNSVSLSIQGAIVTLDISSDKTLLKAGETATISFTFSSAPTGFAAGDITVSGGTLGALTTVDSTHYTATFTPTASAASGTASISVAKGSYTGGGGNLGEGASVPSIFLDTLAPTLQTLNPDDNGFLAAGNALVATFTEAVSAGTGSIRLVDDTSNTTVTYAITDSAIVIDGNKLTLTPTTALVAGHNYHLSIDSTALEDSAGNAYVGIANATSWNFGATNLSTTLNPVTGDGRINDDEKTAGLIVLSGTVSSLNPAVLTALTASDIVVKITVPRDKDSQSSDNKVVTCTGVTYDSTTGEWTATLPATWEYANFNIFGVMTSTTTKTTLINGDTDNIAVTITGRNGTAAAGLTATLSDTMTVDLSDPATPTLTLAGDTGSSNSDGITRNGLINVGALEAGGTWQYSLDNGANWQPGTGTSLALTQDGAVALQVKQADAAGNASGTRSLAVTLDTQADAPGVNAIATDYRINASETSSAISGTADANASVSLVIGANTRTVTANSSGVWSYTLVAGDITAMGQGNEVIQVTQADKAGNTSAATKAVIEVDTVLPTVTLANTGSASLLAGQSTTFTATLSELSASFSVESLTVSGGTVTNFKADATGLVYTGTFTPDSNSTTAGSIGIAAGAVGDASGNTNSAASNTLALTINTVQPNVAVTSSVAATTPLHAGETATVTFTLSAASSDFTAADVTTIGGTLGNWTAVSGTVYTASFTPDANSRAPGSVRVASGTFANAATNTNADGADDNNTVSFAIATARPTLTISSDLGTLGGAQTSQITFTFSEDPGSSFTLADIALTGGTLSALNGAGNVYTAVFTPTAGFVGAAVISVANGLYTNADGSLGQAAGSPSLTIDAVAPTVAISRSASGTLGAGQTDTITFDFSEAPGSSFTLDDIDLSGGTLGSLSAVSATQYVATFTPDANERGTANIRLGNGRFNDVAGNVNADGNDANNLLAIGYATGNSNVGNVTIASAPSLRLSADTGASSLDGITNNGVIEVSALMDGATWSYSLDGGANWLAGSGSSFALTSAGVYTAAAGSRQLQVRQTAGGLTSNAGTLAENVDFRPAYSSNVSVALDVDTGSSATDAITYRGAPVVSGLAATDTWRYSIDNGLNWVTGFTATWTDAGQSYSANIISNGQLWGQDKTYNTLMEATDVAGNTRTVQYAFRQDNFVESPNFKLTPDGALVAATNIEPGATVSYALWLGSTSVYRGPNYTPPTTPGRYNLNISLTDVAGNSSSNSFSFDVVAPVLGIKLSAVAGGTGGFVINGQGASDQSGISVSSAGDVNGDGLNDLIVGASGSDPAAGSGAGRSYVVFGKTGTGGIDLSAVAAGTDGFVINGQCALDESGISVSNVGDVNGDGLADLIVGASASDPAARVNAGRSYVVFGKTSTTAVDLSSMGATWGFVINGQCGGDFSGSSVSSAGDVNGDGLADLIVGASQSDPTAGLSEAGRSYVVFGKTGTAAIDLSAVAAGPGGFVINGECQGDNSGISVSSAGDVNGDGLADLIVGANKGGFLPSSLGNQVGRSFVVFGKTGSTAIDLSSVAGGTDGFVINGQCYMDKSGFSVSSAGDVNGDGLADLIVGASQSDPTARLSDAGRSYVVFGKTATGAINLSEVAAGVGGFVINGQCIYDLSGFSVSGAGDVNGDGLADVILGAKYSDPVGANNGGRSYVVFGKTTTAAIDLSAVASGVGGFVMHGQCLSDQSGISVSGAGDVNGDGLADLLVGAPNSDALAGADSGRSYVIFGNTTGDFGQTAVDWLGTDGADTRSDNGKASTLVAGAGNDILTATAASVLYGGAGSDRFLINQAMITALQSPMGQGGNVGQLARIDGGSGTDILALWGSGLTLDLTKVANQSGANPDGGSRIDSVEIINLSGIGNNTLVLAGRDVQDMAGMNLYNSGNGWTGLAASVARHQLLVEGDSGDVLTLGTEWSRGGTAICLGENYKIYNAGSGAQVLVHEAVTVNLAPPMVHLSAVDAGVGGFVINGQCESDLSGSSVSSAGDVNGDGLADLIVGASKSGPTTGGNTGRSYVVFGKTSGTSIDLSAVANQSGGFVINGQCASDNSGISVSAAGDVNGDGYSDLIVGASSANNLLGRSYVVFGKATGSTINLSSVANGIGGFAINGFLSNALNGLGTSVGGGFSVSSAGDVNGDGLADLIVGAPFGNNSLGRSFVVFGKASFTAINLSEVAGGQGGFVINGNSTTLNSGNSVSSAGDVNGDGLADLIVGLTMLKSEGACYVVFGKATGTAVDLTTLAKGNAGGFVINRQSDSGMSETRVSAAGDVNGDGLADLIVGVSNMDKFSGRSYLVFGKATFEAVNLSAVAAGTGGFVINGDVNSRSSGSSVSAAGDVNGDGLADLIVGAPSANAGVGRSYVVYGKTSGIALNLSDVAASKGGFVINADFNSLSNGTSVSAAGDVNGDGLADLIIGAPNSNAQAGRSYVIFGGTTGVFEQTAVDQMGTDGADMQSDNGTASTLVAGAGQDTLTATAASVLYGGAGSDTFKISQAMVTALQSPMGTGGNVDQLARIDGGSGTDRISLTGAALTFDLTLVANQAASNPDGGSRIDSVEIFDISGWYVNNTLKLTSKDVLELGSAKLFDPASSRQQLMVLGDKGDIVDLADGTGTSGWTKESKLVTHGNAGLQQVWNHKDSLATLYISSDVTVI